MIKEQCIILATSYATFLFTLFMIVLVGYLSNGLSRDNFQLMAILFILFEVIHNKVVIYRHFKK